MKNDKEALRVLNYLASVNAKYACTTVDKNTLKTLLLSYGSTVFNCGKLWNIKSKHLGAGIYELSLTERK